MQSIDAAVLLSISEMIDLAIGTPEMGVVDFNMLQTVLHCLAQQLRVLGKSVEVRGSLVNLPMPATAKDHVQTIAVTEYLVDTDKPQSKKAEKPPPSAEPDTILVVERIKRADSIMKPTGSHEPTPPTPGLEHAMKSTHSPAPRPVSSTEKLSLVTISKFNMLESTVDDLKNRVYGSMPKNEEILGEVRSQTNMKAITDMWTNLNVSSRLEAAEAGIAKLSSLVEDLINDTAELQDGVQRRESKTQGAVSRPTTPAQPRAPTSAPSRASTPVPPGGATTAQPPASGTAAPGALTPPAPGAPTAAPPGASTTTAPRLSTPYTAQSTTGGPQMSTTGPRPSTPATAGEYATGRDYAPTYGVADDALNAIQAAVSQLRGDLDHLTQVFYASMEEIQPGFEPPEIEYKEPTSTIDQIAASAMETDGTVTRAEDTAAGGTPAAAGTPTGTTAKTTARTPAKAAARTAAVAGGKAGTAEGTGTAKSETLPAADRRQPKRSSMAIPAGLGDRVNALERHLKECFDQIGKTEGVVHDQLQSFQDQLEYLLKQVSLLTGDFSSGKLSPDLIKDLQGLMQLFETVQDMQEQLKKVHETALQLAAEKEDRQHHIHALLEQIELLKAIKLDREDMVEAMAEKADLRMLARKVSHDQFELACDDLSRGLEHAVGKLNMQEALWQQALDDIQREIETKLDKMELSPVKDFFNSKLKLLQDNLKQMASLRREAEAAGTKRRLLRDVNCISCDANAVMTMDAPPALPVAKPLPATLSMKPYLSYELDSIRKTQASNLPRRNLHDWEIIDKQMTQPKLPQKVRSETDKHLCNRYCGGSHTVTTAAQRVARLGHFIKQWGPDVLPLSSGFAAGDDGRMYRVSPAEGGATVGPGGAVDSTCTPKSPTRKSDASKPLPKPLLISAECRCLDSSE